MTLTSIFGCVNKSLTISALSLSTAIVKAVFVLEILLLLKTINIFVKITLNLKIKKFHLKKYNEKHYETYEIDGTI